MKNALILLTVFLLASCVGGRDLDRPPVPLGNFRLGHNIVVAPNLTKGGFVSREISDERWVEAMKKAVDDRFGRYEGDKIYNFGVSLEGYVLAQPGIPIVLSPQSVLIFKITVWDDFNQKKLNDEPHQITVLESVGGEAVVGSGLVMSAEQQLDDLVINAAKQIERWLVTQNRREGWFRETPDVRAARIAKLQALDLEQGGDGTGYSTPRASEAKANATPSGGDDSPVADLEPVTEDDAFPVSPDDTPAPVN